MGVRAEPDEFVVLPRACAWSWAIVLEPWTLVLTQVDLRLYCLFAWVEPRILLLALTDLRLR